MCAEWHLLDLPISIVLHLYHSYWFNKFGDLMSSHAIGHAPQRSAFFEVIVEQWIQNLAGGARHSNWVC